MHAGFCGAFGLLGRRGRRPAKGRAVTFGQVLLVIALDEVTRIITFLINTFVILVRSVL